jgi:hypothetical protein
LTVTIFCRDLDICPASQRIPPLVGSNLAQ